jgi:hypothetical protein
MPATPAITPKKASKFRVEKAATPQGAKRNVEEMIKGSAPEIPKASKVTFTDAPKPQATPRRLPASAPVKVCIFKITDCSNIKEHTSPMDRVGFDRCEFFIP